MTNKLFYYIMLVLCSNTYGTELNENNKNVPIIELNENNKNVPIIELNENNTAILMNEVNEKSISFVIDQIYQLSENDIYIYIDTPGGSVYEGQKLVNTIEYMKDIKNITCVVQQASSMGFVILQSCPLRTALKGSMIMQHQISTRLYDEKAKLKNYMHYIDNMEDELIEMQSRRIGITKKEFIDKTYHDWYLTPKMALKYNVIDKIVKVGCKKSMMSSFFNATILNNKISIVGYRKCPLIKEPTSIEIKDFDYS